MLKIHKSHSKSKLLIIPITSICITFGLLGFYYLTYTPELSHAESVTYEPPKETRTMDDITYMQDITPEICQNSTLDQQYTLTDRRDNNTYTVARIKNQTDEKTNCWMTQNLRLIGKRTLTPIDSDVTANYYLPASVVLSEKDFSDEDAFMSKLYYENNVTYGAYYNWYTATAGTGKQVNSIGTANATSSICPKEWTLPTGGYQTGELYDLLNGLNGYSVANSPYNFVYAGHTGNGQTTVGNDGVWGYYYSATRSGMNAYYTSFSNDSSSIIVSQAALHMGDSIRCIARSEAANNIDITINSTISLEVTNKVGMEKNESNPSTADLKVKVSSNQPYVVKLSSDDSTMRSSTTNVTVPAKSGLLNTAENGWGIMKYNANAYTAITSTPELFYEAASPEVKELLLKVGISTAPDLPSGEYSTNITVTATQN